MTKLVAVDPGDVYTGVAFFDTNVDGKWFCEDAQEFSPPEFEDALAELIFLNRDEPPPIVIYERWRLYRDKATLQTGSEFLAVQHIGVILYIIRVHNRHASRHEYAESQGKLMTCELRGGLCQDPKMQPRLITVAGQMADIKKPTTGILRHLGIKSVAKPISRESYHGRDHVVDAELHGWHHILKTLEGVPA